MGNRMTESWRMDMSVMGVSRRSTLVGTRKAEF